jgi:hypothetical protein
VEQEGREIEKELVASNNKVFFSTKDKRTVFFSLKTKEL